LVDGLGEAGRRPGVPRRAKPAILSPPPPRLRISGERCNMKDTGSTSCSVERAAMDTPPKCIIMTAGLTSCVTSRLDVAAGEQGSVWDPWGDLVVGPHGRHAKAAPLYPPGASLSHHHVCVTSRSLA